MSEFLNLNLGPKNKLTTQPLKDYNKDGAILFTTDTQELFINDGAVSSNNDVSNRKQINAQYAIALWNPNNENDDPFTYQDLINALDTVNNSLTDFETNLNAKLNKKMDKADPMGTGTLNLGTLNISAQQSFPGALIGSHLVQGENDQNAIISGQYNKKIGNAIFVIGNGTKEANRKNALAIVKNDTTGASSYAIFEGDIFTNGSNDINNLVITQKNLDDALSNIITKPYIAQTTPPTSEEDKKLLWINTAKGNGVLNYWTGTKWQELSAVYS